MINKNTMVDHRRQMNLEIQSLGEEGLPVGKEDHSMFLTLNGPHTEKEYSTTKDSLSIFNL